MGVLLPDDLARDLGLLLDRGWFVASFQKVRLKTRWAYLVNATKDPAWKLLLDYDPSFPGAFTGARLYRNEFEFTDLAREGLLRAIVQPDVIDGPWDILIEEAEQGPPWSEDAKARMLAELPGARLDENEEEGYCLIFVPVPGRDSKDDISIQRPDVGVRLGPIWLYQVDTGWDTRDDGKLALFIDDGDVIQYVKQVLDKEEATADDIRLSARFINDLERISEEVESRPIPDFDEFINRVKSKESGEK